jgi:hypothetical protein
MSHTTVGVRVVVIEPLPPDYPAFGYLGCHIGCGFPDRMLARGVTVARNAAGR